MKRKIKSYYLLGFIFVLTCCFNNQEYKLSTGAYSNNFGLNLVIKNNFEYYVLFADIVAEKGSYRIYKDSIFFRPYEIDTILRLDNNYIFKISRFKILSANDSALIILSNFKRKLERNYNFSEDSLFTNPKSWNENNMQNYLLSINTNIFVFPSEQSKYCSMHYCNAGLTRYPNEPVLLFYRGVLKHDNMNYYGALNDFNKIPFDLIRQKLLYSFYYASTLYQLKMDLPLAENLLNECIYSFERVDLQKDKAARYYYIESLLRRGIIKYNSGRKTEACFDWDICSNFSDERANKMLKEYCK